MSSLKERFPIFRHHPDLIYLDSAATAHKPHEVIEALTHFYSAEYATVHRAIYRGALLASEKYHLARETACQFLHAASIDEIVFTRGTTDALNLVAHSFGGIFLQEGDEILLSPMEHHSNLVPWQMIAAQKGAKLTWMGVAADSSLQWQQALTPRTKIVALAHVSNVTGTVHPIREIATAAHDQGAIVVIDGAQAAPHMPIDVQALGVDFYAFSSHKCYGPTGLGVLYGRRELLSSMPPLQGGGDMIENVFLETSLYQPPPLRFEAGTPIIASAVAFTAALRFIVEIGYETIATHETSLLQRATAHLSQIPHLHILGSALHKGPIITFHVDKTHPLDIATLLDSHAHIAIRSGHLCAQPCLRHFGLSSAARASFAMYNTPEEIDRFAEALSHILHMLRSHAPTECDSKIGL
jgi:cysteine desulfurase/selenocysteine lyase